MATSIKCTPDVSKPFKKKAYIVGPRLAASTSEVVSMCSPAGSFLIPSAVSFFFFFLYNCQCFVSFPSPIGKILHSFLCSLARDGVKE